MRLPEIEPLGGFGEAGGGAEGRDGVPGVEGDLCRLHTQVEAVSQPTSGGSCQSTGLWGGGGVPRGEVAGAYLQKGQVCSTEPCKQHRELRFTWSEKSVAPARVGPELPCGAWLSHSTPPPWACCALLGCSAPSAGDQQDRLTEVGTVTCPGVCF